MKRVIKILIFIVLISVVGAAFARYYFSHAKFYYAGTLETTKVDLSVQIPSTLSKVKVQEGDPVKVGDTLIELTCDDVKIANDFANDNYARYMKLSKSGTATAETLDLMRNRKAEAELRQSWCSIQSPISGRVMSRYHEPGEWVSPGMKVLTLADSRDVWAYIYVPHNMVAKLSVGMKVKAYLPELDRRVFEGKIAKINEEAEFTPKNVQTQEERSRLVFGVKIRFHESNAEGILKAGMTLEVDLP